MLGNAFSTVYGSAGSGEPVRLLVVHSSRFSMPYGLRAGFLSASAARRGETAQEVAASQTTIRSMGESSQIGPVQYDQQFNRGCRRKHGFNQFATAHLSRLIVYQRLNDIPVPGMYGPSAD